MLLGRYRRQIDVFDNRNALCSSHVLVHEASVEVTSQ